MLAGGETVVVAVSGGPDSLALLHALLRLRGPLDLTLRVAHFDHRMRAGSERDASWVRRHAERLGLPVALGLARGDRPAGRSPEEWAREGRLAFLAETARGLGARVATGHTADDQAETVLMRLLAGAGLRGLGGIPPVRGPFVRPLIDVRRADTEAVCRALRLRPRRDPTNADPRFRRNAVRRDLLPLLAGRFNRRIVETLARMADVLRDEDAYLDDLAAKRRAEIGAPGDARGERIPVGPFAELPPALQRRLIRLAAPLDAEATERVRMLALSGTTGDAADLPGPLNARLEYGFLVLGGTAPSLAAPPQPAALDVPGVTDLPSWGFRVTAWLESTPPAAWPDGRRACVLDADRIRLPLAVRPPRAGDRFRPLGMGRAKKLGDFFTDEKVSRGERPRTPVAVDAVGTVAWVAGHRVDDRAKVTARTRRFLWLAIDEEGERP